MPKKVKKMPKPVKKAKVAKPAAKPAKKAAKPAKKAQPPAAKKKVAAPKKEKLSSKPVKVLKALLKKVTTGKPEKPAKAAAPAKAAKVAKAPEAPAPKPLTKKEIKAQERAAKIAAAELEAEEQKAEMKAAAKDIILTDAEGRQLCRVKDCDQPSVVESYCRYHYLFFWKKIQNRKKILSEGKLEQYIEELTSRYPLKFLELIRKDLSSEPDFMSAIQELDIDEGNNIDEFEDENFIEEVRGISSTDTERVDDEY